MNFNFSTSRRGTFYLISGVQIEIGIERCGLIDKRVFCFESSLIFEWQIFLSSLSKKKFWKFDLTKWSIFYLLQIFVGFTEIPSKIWTRRLIFLLIDNLSIIWSNMIFVTFVIWKFGTTSDLTTLIKIGLIQKWKFTLVLIWIARNFENLFQEQWNSKF